MAQALGLIHWNSAPVKDEIGCAARASGAALGSAGLDAIFQASHSMMARPEIFAAACRLGVVRIAVPSPIPRATSMNAKPPLIPAISGSVRPTP